MEGSEMVMGIQIDRATSSLSDTSEFSWSLPEAGQSRSATDERWRARSLTQNVGSLLWMAPELFAQKHIDASDAPFLDVFR